MPHNKLFINKMVKGTETFKCYNTNTENSKNFKGKVHVTSCRKMMNALQFTIFQTQCNFHTKFFSVQGDLFPTLKDKVAILIKSQSMSCQKKGTRQCQMLSCRVNANNHRKRLSQMWLFNSLYSQLWCQPALQIVYDF